MNSKLSQGLTITPPPGVNLHKMEMDNLGLLQMFKYSGVLFCENYMLYLKEGF